MMRMRCRLTVRFEIDGCVHDRSSVFRVQVGARKNSARNALVVCIVLTMGLVHGDCNYWYLACFVSSIRRLVISSPDLLSF
jgi:hypothetical protein